MVTLHACILRELLKTFGLVVTAITVLFTMGGGIYNVMRYEGVTTTDLFRVMPMLIPIVVTLTMPLAALFTATIVYGRLAADNELVACRSAGINVHRLFLSAILLSVFVAVFTTLFANYVIPSSMRKLDQFARTNLCDIASAKLKQKGSIAYEGRFFLTAESANVVGEDELKRKGFPTGPGLNYLLVGAPTFLQIEKEEVVRFISAKWGLCQFDTRESDPIAAPSPGDVPIAASAPQQSPVKVTVIVQDGTDFEVGRRAAHIEQQSVGPYPVPIKIPSKASFASLDRLFEWTRMPWLYDEVAAQIDGYLKQVQTSYFFADCISRLASADHKFILNDDNGRQYEISAGTAASETKKDRLLLLNPEVVTQSAGSVNPTRYRAPRAELIARPGTSSPVELRLLRTPDGPVLEFNPRSEDYNKPIEKPTLSLDNLQFPGPVMEQMSRVTRAMVIQSPTPLTPEKDLEDQRAGLQAAAAKFQRKVVALIHFRLGFSSSVLVTILMGAALGVIFRGSRALAAFGLAFVPFSIVAILMVMGRQLGEQSSTQPLGPWVIWGGLVAMAAADWLILRLGIRR